MKAVFIGQDGSRGFKNGKEYEVCSRVMAVAKNQFTKQYGKIFIQDINSNKWCNYNNVESMLEDWKF